MPDQPGHDSEQIMPISKEDSSSSPPAAPADICFRPRRWRWRWPSAAIAVELATDHRAAHFKFPARAVHLIPSATLRGRNPFSVLRTAALLTLGTWKARSLMRRVRPAAVVGFGGYPTVPPLLAATMRNMPTVLHEQNGVMGRANRLLAPRVTAIATGFRALENLDPALQGEDRVHRQSGASAGDRGGRDALRGAAPAGSICWCSAAARARA